MWGNSFLILSQVAHSVQYTFCVRGIRIYGKHGESIEFFKVVYKLYADKTEWRGTNEKRITRTSYMKECTYFYTNVYIGLKLQLF
jgi:hypothetical protein